MLSPRDARARWKDAQESFTAGGASRPPVKVALLASYTIDPLVPYLGVSLAEGGCRPVLRPAPYNQVVQECLGDDSRTARFAPDVLVVSPLLEELREPGELAEMVDVAATAARRWQATLVLVLPPVPGPLLRAAGSGNHPAGMTVAAYAARERAREQVLGVAGAYVDDLEAVVRTVGTSRAYHPGLWNYAKIPFTEEVFAGLGASVGRLLRLRLGESCGAAVLDVTSLAGTTAEAERVAGLMKRLQAHGVQVLVRGDLSGTGLWRRLERAGSEIVRLPDDWTFSDLAPCDQARALLERSARPGTRAALLSAGSVPQAICGRCAGDVELLGLGPNADQWWAEVAQSSLFDSLPFPGDTGRPAGLAAAAGSQATGSQQAAQPATAGLSLEAFVAGLEVDVEFRPAVAAHEAKISEMMLRTKDFTLGTTMERTQLAAAMADESQELLVGFVSDRIGDYGLSVVAAFRREGAAALVDALLISCPVMGRGVEDKVMKRLIEVAAGRGCERIVLNYVPTGRNQVALDFLQSAVSRQWLPPGNSAPVIELAKVG
jgi:hypothetical protein